MSNEKNKPQDAKQKAGKAPTAKTPVPPPAPIKVVPLFRRIDWFALAFAFIAVWGVYLLTLAPELTLEDSGELCTASYYAGIPHPPGYPFWSIYSWFWTWILPIGNVAWRVEVGESCAAAMACGLVALMVSRGSSMLIEGIEELKTMDRKWENAICVVCGIVAGLSLGFDNFMWKESIVINRISVFDVPWLMVVTVCLLRWIYAPHQRRYLYIGMFFFGLCLTIHQTMLVAAMGIEVAIALTSLRLGRDFFMWNSIVYALVLMLAGAGKLPAYESLDPMFKGIFHFVGLGSIGACIWLAVKTKGLGDRSLIVILAFICWTLGAAFYFYEPVSGMTTPPMQWGYPRTVDGFFHALSRGQYEKSMPTDVVHDPGRFLMQLGILGSGLAESYSLVFVFLALLPLFFVFKMQKRERAWIIGLVAIYFCIGGLLTMIMNTSLERQSRDENKVFFAASHAVAAIMLGYGLALMTAYMATHYQKFRRWGLWGGGIAILLALYCLWDAAGKLYFGPAGQIGLLELPHWIIQAFAKDQYGLPIFANLILVALPVVFIVALLTYRNRGPILIALVIFSFLPVYSGLSHWYKSEQRNHWFGYWFGHDMFTPPFGIYPEMARNTILFGGTDPGRFCPTYMIFCESFIPHNCQPLEDQKFDRRDVYLITQNALADGTYLDYLRSQYFRSQQTDPPFFSRFFRLIVATIGIGDSANVITDVNNEDAGKGDTGNSLVEGIANLLDNTLDKPLTRFGKRVENRRRAEGVYPPNEIYIPSPEDLSHSFGDYADDLTRRRAIGQQHPGEEGVSFDNGKVSLAGQVPVMMINGLLCKVIFDRNPTNDFYVEESFPLDWMYPYETPSGIIMKINRNPLSSIPDEVFQKDHEFWSKYSARLCGNWITYDTTVQQIADFAEKIYLHNNYAGFTGDRKFVRDDDAQKAFSKLRSSIAGMYAWRLVPQFCPPEYRPKNDAEYKALVRETDFAFKQAFAFCPYSPEAVYRYVNFLLPLGRFDDALIVAQTCQKLDPYNGALAGLIEQLEEFKKQSAARTQIETQLQPMEQEARVNPADFDNIYKLGAFYQQMQQTNLSVELFKEAVSRSDMALTNPKARLQDVTALAQICAQTGNLQKLEPLLEKMVGLDPNQPEFRYDLACLQSILGKKTDALQNLQLALNVSAARLKTNSAAHDLLAAARTDQRLDGLRDLPEFKKIVPP